ncbi:YjgN family protein [Thauera sinica]|uniref:YjgN family protein n=1 Tax=Thauera sinica TaxID=2665146 RepID=A0ABW1APL2_9RHOO|nr:YjgN family protein [Thauera sp. K11]ATE62307.1 thymidylate kinase [Thauera sp. K11]
MTEAAYAVVFDGELVEGFEHEQVKASLAEMFGLGAERLEQFFSHPRVVVKRGLSHADATRYQDALRRIGAVVTVEPPREAAPAAVPAPSPAYGDGPWQPGADAAPAAGDPAAPAFRDGAPVPPGVAAGTAAEPAPRVLPFAFAGEGFEYFRIWIVNVLLSILTLGIYSPWAKVRTQRYFYGSTSLDGSSFEYLARPMQILKGRIIAFVFFAIYAVAGRFEPLLGMAMMLVLILATPWIVVRSLAFRNHHSAWRGVRFGFAGTVPGAAKALLLWPLAGVLSLGLLMPLAMQRQQRFVIENARYGTSAFGFGIGAGPFYRAFLLLLLGGVVGGALSYALGFLFAPLSIIVMVLVYLGLIAWANVALVNLAIGNSVLGGHRFVARYEFGSYLRLLLGNSVGIVLTLGLFYPWAKVRSARYAAEHIDFVAEDELDGFVAAQRDAVSATGGEVADLFNVDLGL